MKKRLFALFGVSVVTLTSCLKDEIPVAQPDPGNVILNSYEMGVDYRRNAYYDFETNTFVKEHLKTDWDLGFETGTNGWHIVLNTSKSMAAGESPLSDFAAISNTDDVTWRNDAPSWNLDSTAIGDWQNFTGVYVIDLGYSYTQAHLGYCKLEIQAVDDDSYTIHYAKLDGTEEMTVEVPKDDEDYNFSFYSFDTHTMADIEPKKEEWDVVFRQYTHLFNGNFAYLVNGVVSNTNSVEVAEIFDKEFTDVTFEDVANVSFSSDVDIIGYDWKTFTGNGFETHPEKVYIVKTTEGLYYKLRFIDFYNDQGDKGTPTFETAAL